jgi:hypothetical protein
MPVSELNHEKEVKGTVRLDWICMRVVSLESPLKDHQPLYVFNFLFYNFKVLSRSIQKGLQFSCLFGSQFACAQAAIFFVKPYSINAGETSIVLICGSQVKNDIIPQPKPK